jgi:hypothetical protein
MDIEILKEKALALANETVAIVENESLHNNLEYIFETFEKTLVTDFRYDDRGPHFTKTIEHFNKPFLKNLPNLLTEIKKSEIYQHLDNYINANLQSNDPKLDEISFFVQTIINSYVKENRISQSEIETISLGFISDLTSTPAEFNAVVQLVGLILHPEKIDLEDGVKIRKSRKEDFETERRVFISLHEPRHPPATAILEISKKTIDASEIQTIISKSIALLQLFRPGSVKDTTYQMYSSSRTCVNVTSSSGDSSYPVFTYTLNDEESEKLQKFWTITSGDLPVSFYELGGKDKDYLSIAFDRYEEALIQTGIEERRITNIMMGLEALYFKENERQELDYRLQMRMAKVLGMLSYDPVLVKTVVKDAYNIRSIFSHGGLLDAKKKATYEKNYGSVRNLTLLVLDFLRVSLIVAISSEMKKAKWIDLIDNALIRESDNSEMITYLSRAEEITQNSKV